MQLVELLSALLLSINALIICCLSFEVVHITCKHNFLPKLYVSLYLANFKGCFVVFLFTSALLVC